jgi:ribose 5-phosphate isomerase B
MKRIVIGADKSGYALKESVKSYLKGMGYEIEDLGTQTEDDFKPYYEVASSVAKRIQNEEFEKGILFCGTGMGMCIVANKFKGVYAAVVEGSYTARMCSVINSANILTLGGWVTAPQQAIDMVEKWLGTKFAEGFPKERQTFLSDALDKVKKIERENFR